MNIQELIGNAVSGNTAAAAGIYDAYKNNVYYLCLRLVGGNEDAAAGMLQSAFMHIYGKLGLLKDPASFPAWSYMTAAKRCRSYLSGSGRTVDFSRLAATLPDDAGDKKSFPYSLGGSRSELVGDADACRAVEEAVCALPEAERFAVMLFFFCGLDPDQIARNLQADPRSVRRAIISGAGLVGAEIKKRTKDTPALSKFRGAAELGAILSERAAAIRVPERVSDTIVAAGMTMIAGAAEQTENHDFTYASGEEEEEEEGSTGRRLAGAVLIALLVVVLGAVVALAIKFVPQLISDGGETTAVTTTAATDTEETEPTDTADGSKETTANEPETTAPAETDAPAAETTAPQNTPAPVEADYTYVLDASGNATVTGYTGKGGAITIPSTLGGAKVTAIGASAFRGNQTITAVTVPNGVSYIGTYAFLECSNIESVSIPASVKSVGLTILGKTKWLAAQTDTFVTVGDGVLIKINSKDSTITVPSGVKYVSNVFYYIATVNTVKLPDTVWGVGDLAFAVCVNLNSIELPASVTTLGDGMIYQCDKLSSIVTPAGSTAAKWAESAGFGALLK